MFPVKPESRALFMVNPLWIKPDDIEGASMVFLMTLHAFMPAQRSMKALFHLNPSPEFLMALKAFLTGDCVAKGMAAGAVLQTFEPGMSFRKLSRRKLGVQLPL